MVHPTTTESRKAPPPSTSSSHDDKTSPSPSKKLKPSCATGDTAVVSTTKSKSNVKSSDGKINGNISKMFSKQQSSIDKEFEFVEKNAPITKPQGYASATKQLKMVQEEMNAASNDNQFELAQEKKIEVEKLLETTVMERKLYRLCLKTRDISESKIEYHKKKLEFLKCAKYHLLLNIANEYLRHVSPHDVEAMVADENALVCDEDMDWDPEDASNTEDMNSDDEEEERMIMEAEEFVVNDAGNIVYTLENLEDENVEKLVEELVESGLFTEGQINNVRESIDGLVQSGVVDVEDLEDVEDVGTNDVAGSPTKPKHKSSRARKSKKYTPKKTTTSATVDLTFKAKKKPPSQGSYNNFVSKTSHNVPTKVKGSSITVRHPVY